MSVLVEAAGMVAGTLTTAAFVPQVWTTWRTRNVEGVNPVMFALFGVGVLLWIGYGVAIRSLPVILFNVVTFLLVLAQFCMLLAFRRRSGGG